MRFTKRTLSGMALALMAGNPAMAQNYDFAAVVYLPPVMIRNSFGEAVQTCPYAGSTATGKGCRIYEPTTLSADELNAQCTYLGINYVSQFYLWECRPRINLRPY